MRTRLLAAAAVLAALTGWGCGRTTERYATFNQAYGAQRERLDSIGRELAGALQGSLTQSDEQLAARLKSLDTRLGDELVRLDRLHPPSALRSGMADVRSRAALLENDLRRLANAVRAHSATLTGSLARQLLRDAAGLRRAGLALDRRLGQAPQRDPGAPPT